MIEASIGKIGLPISNLTQEQYQLPKVRVTITFAQSLGITIGCLLGMFPLLWLDQHDRNLKAIFYAIDEDGDGYIQLDELKRCLELTGIHFREEVFEDLIREIDTSHDGKIEYAEFKTFMLRLEKAILESKLKGNKFVKWLHDIMDSP
jgi:hypothetical protein